MRPPLQRWSSPMLPLRTGRVKRVLTRGLPLQKIPTMVVVAAALVDAEGRVLLQQRPHGKAMAGLWEFPGGKVEPGELPEAALARELEEELGIAVERESLAPAALASRRNDS